MNLRRKLTFFLVTAFWFQLSASCSFARQEKFIRVAVIQETDSVSINVVGHFEISDVQATTILEEGRNLHSSCTASKAGISLKDKNFPSTLLISAGHNNHISVNARKFNGSIQLIKLKNNKLLVVNHVAVEDYVKGILYHEVSHYWPVEALKAQAIASRTYALYQAEQNKECDFDVTADTSSQVYGGKTSQRYRTNRAVEQTKGEVLAYNNKLFPAYFHATCGGHTQDASVLWNIDIKPLKGVKCGFCNESPHFTWRCNLSLKELERKIASSLVIPGEISDIQALERDKTSRVREVEIIHSAGHSEKISSKKFRSLIGANIIRSTNFTLEKVGSEIIINGYGWGHGVGMCQWGAYFMAKSGRSAEEILKHYYPGSEILLIEVTDR